MVEWKNYRKAKKHAKGAGIVLALATCFLLNGCQTGPVAIVTGKDNCCFCKMTISDPRYGAELLTRKGKVYKFDDMHCIRSFLHSKMINEGEVKDIYLVDYAGNHSLVKAQESFLLQSEDIHGPMNGNMIAFKEKDSMKGMAVQLKAIATSWEQLDK